MKRIINTLVLLALWVIPYNGSFAFMLNESQPSFSPDGETILFYSNKIGIGIMTSDGKGKTPLINDNDINNKVGRDSINPVYSPDGEKVAFATKNDIYDYRGDIYICDKDGSNVIRLTYLTPDIEAPGESVAIPLKKPIFSPDGSRIVFVHTEADHSRSWIYTINVDGTDLKRLSNEDTYDINPVYSPDGKKILYTSHRSKKTTGYYVFSFRCSDGDVYIMNIDGSEKKRLTDGKSNYQNPSISPDGNIIAYAGGEDISEGNIYIMNLATRGVKSFLDKPTRYIDTLIFVPEGCEINPDHFSVIEDTDLGVTLLIGYGECSFSPDGGKIVFSGGGVEVGETLTYIINTDGSGFIETNSNYSRDGER